MAENANFAEVAVERVAVGAARRLAEAFPAHELVQEKEKKEKKEKKDKKEKKVLKPIYSSSTCRRRRKRLRPGREMTRTRMECVRRRK